METYNISCDAYLRIPCSICFERRTTSEVLWTYIQSHDTNISPVYIAVCKGQEQGTVGKNRPKIKTEITPKALSLLWNRGRVIAYLYLDTVTDVSEQATLYLRQWLRTFSFLPRRRRMYALTLTSFKTTTLVVAWTVRCETRFFIIANRVSVRVFSERPTNLHLPRKSLCKKRKTGIR